MCPYSECLLILVRKLQWGSGCNSTGISPTIKVELRLSLNITQLSLFPGMVIMNTDIHKGGGGGGGGEGALPCLLIIFCVTADMGQGPHQAVQTLYNNATH